MRDASWQLCRSSDIAHKSLSGLCTSRRTNIGDTLTSTLATSCGGVDEISLQRQVSLPLWCNCTHRRRLSCLSRTCSSSCPLAWSFAKALNSSAAQRGTTLAGKTWSVTVLAVALVLSALGRVRGDTNLLVNLVSSSLWPRNAPVSHARATTVTKTRFTHWKCATGALCHAPLVARSLRCEL